MTSAAAPTLDLSRLPLPHAVVAPAFEQLLAARLADLRSRAPDIDALLESDPAVKLQEVDAYRELLVLARIDDAVRATMLAFAVGADLDHLAAIHGLSRLVIDAEAQPPIYETDAQLRHRVLLAPEALAAAGPHAAWVAHALAAHAGVRAVDVWSPVPGQVSVAVQAHGGDGAPSPELVERVRAHLSQPHIKPLTDILSVKPVLNIPYAIAVEVFVLPGPAPELVRREVAASLSAMADARRLPARDVPVSAVIAAATTGAVDRVVVTSPAGDIARGHGEVAVCTAVDVVVRVHDG